MEHREIYKRRFNAACSVLLWLPLSIDPSAQSVVVGFQNGAIRVLEQAKDHWSLIYAMKPHKVRERASPVCCCFPPTYPPVCSIFLFRCCWHYQRILDHTLRFLSTWTFCLPFLPQFPKFNSFTALLVSVSINFGKSKSVAIRKSLVIH
jgi:hypothetical protein